MHYFRYTTGDALRRCLWGAPSMPLNRKAVVFAHMRPWYAERANANLTLALEDEAAAQPLGKLLQNNASLTSLILRSNNLSVRAPAPRQPARARTRF